MIFVSLKVDNSKIKNPYKILWWWGWLIWSSAKLYMNCNYALSLYTFSLDFLTIAVNFCKPNLKLKIIASSWTTRFEIGLQFWPSVALWVDWLLNRKVKLKNIFNILALAILCSRLCNVNIIQYLVPLWLQGTHQRIMDFLIPYLTVFFKLHTIEQKQLQLRKANKHNMLLTGFHWQIILGWCKNLPGEEKYFVPSLFSETLSKHVLVVLLAEYVCCRLPCRLK